MAATSVVLGLAQLKCSVTSTLQFRQRPGKLLGSLAYKGRHAIHTTARAAPSRGRTYTRETSYIESEDGAIIEVPESFLLDDTKGFLEGEVKRIFTTGAVTKARYSDDMRFEDPVSKQTNLDGFVLNIQLLRTIFDIDFVLHDISINDNQEIVTRWTMDMKMKVIPWHPQILVSGQSFYTVDPKTGRLASQRDKWDSLHDNKYLSLEALVEVVRSLTSLQTTPKLGSPQYVVLRKAKEYEVRKYSSYLVAETAMPAGSGPADGKGFQTLANYLFSDNAGKVSMVMTTPVFTKGGSEELESGRMQFVLEEKYGASETAMPEPTDARVVRKLREGTTKAAIKFSGLPFDFEVVEAERRLRAALLLDGLKPTPGYELARYNDPFTLPFLRRNEIQIDLKEFKL